MVGAAASRSTISDFRDVASRDNYDTSDDLPPVEIGFSQGNGVREERSVFFRGGQRRVTGFST